MSEYQRFVSYLYEYQDNEKSKNCGFSRVEVRNRRCKIEVHMKLPQLPFVPDFQVYAFVPLKEQLLGIHLGKASYHQGAVYGLFTVPQQQIGGQSYTLDDLGGLLVKTDAGQIFATAWKEMTIFPDRFVPPETPESAPQVRAASLESLEEYQFPPVQDTPNPTDVPRLRDAGDTSDTADPSETAGIPEMPGGSEFPEEPAAPGGSGNTNTFESSETSVMPDDRSSGQPAASETLDSVDSDPYGRQSPDPDEETPSAEMPRHETQKASSSKDRWQKIQDAYPHFDPFFDEEIHQCVQLSLKDLPDLGKYALYIGANQFLTHGCQTYQHLLLGRFSEGDPDEYVLGVPGIYDEKERFLAGMFGFPNFKPARNKTIRPGQFGYWYRFIY